MKIAVFTILLLVFGCSSSSENGPENNSSVSFRLTTVGKEPVEFKFSPDKFEGFAFYDPVNKQTHCSIAPKPSESSEKVPPRLFSLQFENGEEGVRETSRVMVVFGEETDFGPSLFGDITGETSITKYEDVGGYIEGEFKGRISSLFGLTDASIEGSFQIKRVLDKEMDNTFSANN